MSLRESVRAIIEQIIGPRFDALAAYPARVETQHADGTLDVVPDLKRVPPMTNVPIRYGVPGVRAKVAKNARVLVEFAGGDLERPIATVWESASVTELTVAADKVRLADGDRPLAREGDSVVVLLSPASLALLMKPSPPSAVPIAGYIVKGSSKVKGA